jgi:basic membrane protein A and related proteins
MVDLSKRLAPPSSERRRLLTALVASPLVAACQGTFEGPERGPIAVAFLGRIKDGGFDEQGHLGLLRMTQQFNMPFRFVDGVGTERESVLNVLRELASSPATMIAVHGGSASEAVQRAAWEFPRKRFTLIQGDRLRPNLAIYRVRDEQSAWLAGAAASLLSKSGVLGHVSTKDRDDAVALHAAFAAGARTTNARIRVLDAAMPAPQDADAISRMAMVQISAGVDHLFVTGSTTTVVEAVRGQTVRLIGQERDWVATHPSFFVASAVADTGAAIVQLGRDMQDSIWRGDLIRYFGLRYPEMVRLVTAKNVPPSVLATLDDLQGQLAAGRIQIPRTDRDRKLEAASR